MDIHTLSRDVQPKFPCNVAVTMASFSYPYVWLDQDPGWACPPLNHNAVPIIVKGILSVAPNMHLYLAASRSRRAIRKIFLVTY